MLKSISAFAPRNLIKKLRETIRSHCDERKQLARLLLQRDAFVAAGGTRRFALGYDYPCLNDNKAQIPFEPHYFYHPAWACRVLRIIDPAHHVDISSIFSFAGCISAFWPTDYYEYQPPTVKLEGLHADRVDLCALPFADKSQASLSCMHVIEHVGLGRYGYPLDPDGDIKAAKELLRVLAPGGHFLFVTPVAEIASVEFNAHRIYSFEAVMALFPSLKLQEFAVVLDDHHRGLIRHAAASLLVGQRFACGCFHFTCPL